jgi:hypothetical protein
MARALCSTCFSVPFILSLFFFNLGRSLGESYLSIAVHCKKRLAIFPSPAGMSLTKLSLAGNNYSRLGRVWLVTSRLGTGTSRTFFYSVLCNILFHFCTYYSGRDLKQLEKYTFLKCAGYTLYWFQNLRGIYLLKGTLQYTGVLFVHIVKRFSS